MVQNTFPWARWEIQTLEARHQESDVMIAARLRVGGVVRSAEDVAKKRRSLGLLKGPGGMAGALAKKGWPPMRGEPEDRDRAFWRSVLIHGVECGAITVTRAA